MTKSLIIIYAKLLPVLCEINICAFMELKFTHLRISSLGNWFFKRDDSELDRKKHFSMVTILSRSGEKQQPHSQKKLKKLCYYSCLHIAQSQSIESYGDSQKRELVNNMPRKKDKEFLKFQII